LRSLCINACSAAAAESELLGHENDAGSLLRQHQQLLQQAKNEIAVHRRQQVQLHVMLGVCACVCSSGDDDACVAVVMMMRAYYCYQQCLYEPVTHHRIITL
jgi:hypothetical protein